ncbi:MAG TPA: hypothetical protein VGF13_02265, partial [Verrucomicrobiae bacterium]
MSRRWWRVLQALLAAFGIQGASLSHAGEVEDRWGWGSTNAMPSWDSIDRWSFQAGIGFITGSTIDEIGMFDSNLGGEAGGEIYLFQVSYKLGRLDPVLFGHQFAVDVELPFVLGVVNENHNDPFYQYNLGLTFRWKTFPWNHRVYTTIETGGGLTYSQHVLQVERERHPDRDRSHLEFYWPLQITLAHPRYREHQLVLFLHHHSGGGLFHTGGANT